MLISYREIIFDTSSNIEIRYSDDEEMRALVGYIIDSERTTGVLPSFIGIVSRFFPFISNLSIIDNIILPLAFHKHMSVREAVGKVEPYVRGLRLGKIINERKENVKSTDLFKAMFIRAMALDPEVVFICDFKYSVTMREFQGMVGMFENITRDQVKMWLGISEGHHIQWDHDMEVTLGT